ncbi:MAG: fibronectin type III domain-containing protein [Candidatus Acidiferrales bacterium]|jgi:hypothetical protein
METRNPRNPSRASAGNLDFHPPVFGFRISIFAFLLVAGCASPGQPVERKAPVPAAVADLAAEQSGNEVVLTFTLPNETVDHRPLKQPPAIEIYRDFELAPATGEPHPTAPSNPALLVTIPSGMVAHYSQQGRVRYADSLDAGDFTGHTDSVAVYAVRTRASEKKDSANSNAAGVRLYPPPDSISDLKADVMPSAVVLAWTPPERTAAGPAPAIGAYRIYRAEAAPGATTDILSLKSPLAKFGETASALFTDPQVVFGTTYAYSVRSVVEYPGKTLESADSNILIVTPRDIFPPAAPLGLIVAMVPAQGDTPAHLELSWAISPETDVAGYNVYRTEQAGAPGARLNNELLLAPAFRDMNVQPGRRYSYTVTAVDRSGNESPMSVSVSGGVPAEGQATP